MLGSVAATIAVLAVASVGFMALFGWLSIRHAATVILGCFVVFGASSIVVGIQAAVGGDSAGQGPPRSAYAQRSPLEDLPKQAKDPDPYAGAAVPIR